MAYVITSPCIDVKDGACVPCCPVDCIYIEKEKSPVGKVACDHPEVAAWPVRALN